jgi:hypothetical protein
MLMTVVNRFGVNNCDEWKVWESQTYKWEIYGWCEL